MKILNLKHYSIVLRMPWVESILTGFKVQCYDRAFNMVGAKTGVATRINEIESHAHLAHCRGHAFHLTLKQ